MAVVKQTRILLDVSNVLQLRLVCNYRDKDEQPCDGEVLYQFGAHKIQRDWRCPRCGNQWEKKFPPDMPLEMREVSRHEAANFSLIQALETLVGSGCGPFTVQLETDGESG